MLSYILGEIKALLENLDEITFKNMKTEYSTIYSVFCQVANDSGYLIKGSSNPYTLVIIPSRLFKMSNY